MAAKLKLFKRTGKIASASLTVVGDLADMACDVTKALHKEAPAITTGLVNSIKTTVRGLEQITTSVDRLCDEAERLNGVPGIPAGTTIETNRAYRRYLESQIDGIKILIKQLKKSNDVDKDQKILVLKLRKKDLEKNGDWVGFCTPKLP